jgi:hypothetical protein
MAALSDPPAPAAARGASRLWAHGEGANVGPALVSAWGRNPLAAAPSIPLFDDLEQPDAFLRQTDFVACLLLLKRQANATLFAQGFAVLRMGPWSSTSGVHSIWSAPTRWRNQTRGLLPDALHSERLPPDDRPWRSSVALRSRYGAGHPFVPITISHGIDTERGSAPWPFSCMTEHQDQCRRGRYGLSVWPAITPGQTSYKVAVVPWSQASTNRTIWSHTAAAVPSGCSISSRSTAPRQNHDAA